jgi:hypothetical protein
MKLYHDTKESNMRKYYSDYYPQIRSPVSEFTSLASNYYPQVRSPVSVFTSLAEAVYWGTPN